MKWDNFVATLTGSERITANLLRARFTITGGSGVGYRPIDPGDEAVAFYFSADGEELHAIRSANPAALGGWELADEPRSRGHRNYTVRTYDPETAEMTIDVADHDHGPAISWFRAARPGWRVLAAGPRSWYSPPADAAAHVLAGDLAALPALARILQCTPAQIPVTVIAEVPDRDDLRYLPARANTTVVEVVGSGNGTAPSRLAAALAEVDLPSDGYLWCSGESADTRAAKKHVRAAGWQRGRADVVGYWRANAEEWTRRFERAGQQRLRTVFTDALAAGRSRQEATDLYDEALEAAGL